jgi:hypothetical protein
MCNFARYCQQNFFCNYIVNFFATTDSYISWLFIMNIEGHFLDLDLIFLLLKDTSAFNYSNT